MLQRNKVVTIGNDPKEYDEMPEKEKEQLQKWIADTCQPSKNLSSRTSYSIKHDFEAVGFYVTNGMFKGALLAAGYKPCTLDAKDIWDNWRFYMRPLYPAKNIQRVPDGGFVYYVPTFFDKMEFARKLENCQPVENHRCEFGEFTYHIYILRDPLTAQVKYIGQTFDLQKSKKRHLSVKTYNGIDKKDTWIHDLKSKHNLEPIMEIVDCVQYSYQSSDYKAAWVKYGEQQGWELLNLAATRKRARIEAKNSI